MTKTARHVRIRPIAGALGAEVLGLDLGDLDDDGFEQLQTALREHLVVFLPGQELTPGQHRALGQRFGELEIHPYIPKLDEEHPEIVVLRSEQGGIADVWHTDVTFASNPPKMSILNMNECPPVGGDTMWSNQMRVFVSISKPLQQLLLGLTAIHTAAVFGHPEQEAEHPVVRQHPESGLASLYVNRQFTKRIPQLSKGESDALLSYLWTFSEQPQFNCRYSWTEGAVGIWDNRITQHYVVNDFVGKRTISRVTVLGDHPEPAGDVKSWSVFPALRSSAYSL